MEKPAITSISDVRSYFTETLGAQCVDQLHRENRLFDALALIGVPAMLVGVAAVLARQPFGIVWLACFVLQGFVLMALGLLNHDLFMHRSVVKGRLGYLLSLCLMIPVYQSSTRFKYRHAAHHSHLGTANDSEQFKVDIDTPWRRVLYASILGALRPTQFFRKRTDQSRPVFIAPHMVAAQARVRLEARLTSAFTLGWIVCAFYWPKGILLGYVLPLCLVTPVAGTIRTVIEHSEFDAANPFQLGCFYTTNVVTRWLFFWDSGDCHFVHHIFPRIPFYRISAAMRLMRPEFLRHGVEEHRHLAPLVWRWFAEGRLYFSPPSRRPAK